jgi:O-antigen/teichoic acid export membrane protein
MLRRMAGNAAALATAGLVAQLVFISIEIAIARRLGSDAFGIFATVHAIVIASLILLDSGMTWWQIESGSRKPESISELWGTTLVMKFIGFVILYPLISLVLMVLGYDQPTVIFFMIFFAYGLTVAAQDSLAAVYIARERMGVNAAFQGGTPIFIGLLVTGVLMQDQGLPSVGAAYVTGGILVTTLWIAVTWRAVPPRLKLGTSIGILRKSYLYGLTNLLVHVFRKGDILLLSVFTSMSQVGIYAAASKLLDLAFKVPLLAAYVVSPALFKQSQADIESYRRSADLLVRFSLISGLAFAVACYPSATWAIQLLFGPQFDAAAAILQVLSASFALKFLAFALQTVLTTRGLHRARTSALAAATAAAAAGHCILIPTIGPIGAAISVVTAEILLCALYIRGIDDVPLRTQVLRRLPLIGFAGVVAAGLPGFLNMHGPIGSVLAVLLLMIMVIGSGYIRLSEVEVLFHGLSKRGSDSRR